MACFRVNPAILSANSTISAEKLSVAASDIAVQALSHNAHRTGRHPVQNCYKNQLAVFPVRIGSDELRIPSVWPPSRFITPRPDPVGPATAPFRNPRLSLPGLPCLLFSAFLLFRFLRNLAGQSPPRPQQLRRQSRSGREDLPHEDADLLLAAGPPADFLDTLRRQVFAVHHSAARLECGKLSASIQRRDLLRQQTKSSPPQTIANVPSTPSNAAASGVPSVARLAKLFLTTSKWMFFSRNCFRSTHGLVRIQADDVHQQGIANTLQPAGNIFAQQDL